jgi:hypothetical protein
MIDPVALATIASAVSVLGNEYLKGVATEAGKASWTRVKGLFGWASEPPAAEIPAKVAAALIQSPEMIDKVLCLLRTDHAGTATAMVGKIESHGGKIVIADTIITDHFQM